MKVVGIIARIFLGLVFVVFGLNKLYIFIPSGPMPSGVAGQFMGALMSTKYIMVVGLFELAGGLLLLINRYVALALCLLAPVIVNILVVNTLMAPEGLPAGIVVTILWLVVFWRSKSAFNGIFQARITS